MDTVCTPDLHTPLLDSFLESDQFDYLCTDDNDSQAISANWKDGFKVLFELFLADLATADLDETERSQNEIHFRILVLDVKSSILAKDETATILTKICGVKLFMADSAVVNKSLHLPNCHSLPYIDAAIVENLQRQLDIENEEVIVREAFEAESFATILHRNKSRLNELKTSSVVIFGKAAIKLDRKDLYLQSLIHRYLRNWSELQNGSEITAEPFNDFMEEVASELVHYLDEDAERVARDLSLLPSSLNGAFITAIQSSLRCARSIKTKHVWIWSLGFWSLQYQQNLTSVEASVEDIAEYLIDAHKQCESFCCSGDGVFLRWSLKYFGEHNMEKEVDQCWQCLWGISFVSLNHGFLLSPVIRYSDTIFSLQ